MEVETRFPTHRAADPRVRVTIREPGTPWPIRFYFLQLENAETGEPSTVNVGFEIGEHFDHADSVEHLEPLDPVTVVRVTSQYGAYLRAAEASVTLNQLATAEALKTLRGPGRKPARLTDDFYRRVAADFEQRKAAGSSRPVSDLAATQYVDKGTASRWLKEARRRGYIKEAQDG